MFDDRSKKGRCKVQGHTRTLTVATLQLKMRSEVNRCLNLKRYEGRVGVNALESKIHHTLALTLTHTPTLVLAMAVARTSRPVIQALSLLFLFLFYFSSITLSLAFPSTCTLRSPSPPLTHIHFCNIFFSSFITTILIFTLRNLSLSVDTHRAAYTFVIHYSYYIRAFVSVSVCISITLYHHRYHHHPHGGVSYFSVFLFINYFFCGFSCFYHFFRFFSC